MAATFFEWLSALLTLTAFWRLGKRTRDGFLWMSIATASWSIWAFLISAPAAILINILGTVINVRNWWYWHKHS